MGRRTLLRRLILVAFATAALAAVALGVSLLLRARSAQNRTPPVERMAACPNTPNCVSSLAEDPDHAVEPLTFAGDPGDAWRRLRELVRTMPRTRVRVDGKGYLAAECTSRVFGFVDDLEFRLDAQDSVIHVRSASRVGYSDLGVNRRASGTDPGSIPDRRAISVGSPLWTQSPRKGSPLDSVPRYGV